VATIGTLNAKLTLQNASFTRGIKGAIAQTVTLRAAMVRTAVGVRGLAGAILGLAGIGGLAHLTKEGLKAGSELQDLSYRLGVSANGFEAMRRSAENAGVDVAGLTNSLTRLQISLVNAAEGDKEAALGFRMLGLDAKALIRLSPEDQLKAVADGFQAIGNAALRLRASKALFGKGGAGMIPFLVEGSDGLRESEARIRGIGLALTSLDVTRLDVAGDTMSDIGRVVKALGRQMALSLSPSLGVMSERFVRFAESGKLAGTVVSHAMHGVRTAMLSVAGIADRIAVAMLNVGAAADVMKIASSQAAGFVSKTVGMMQLGRVLLSEKVKQSGFPKLGAVLGIGASLPTGDGGEREKYQNDLRERIAAMRDEISRINEGGPQSSLGKLYDWLKGINDQFGDMVLNAAKLRAKIGSGTGFDVDDLLDGSKRARDHDRIGGGLRTAKELGIVDAAQRGQAGGTVGKMAERQTGLLQTIAVTLGRIEKRNTGLAA